MSQLSNKLIVIQSDRNSIIVVKIHIAVLFSCNENWYIWVKWRDACTVVRVSQVTCCRVTKGKNGLMWSVWGPMHIHNRFVSRERAE